MWPKLARRIFAAALSAACVFPLGYLLVLSWARDWSFPHILPPRLDASVWSRVWDGGSGIGASLATTAGIAATVALLATFSGFLTSRVIARHPHRSRFVFLAHVPFAMSPVILGTCLLYLFIRLGLAGHIGGVVAGQFIFSYGYSVILFLGFWNERIRALEELVFTLGGSRRQMFARVLLPIAKPMLLVGFFQTFLLSWFDYGLTIMLGSGRVVTLTMKVYAYIAAADFYLAAACATLLILPPLAMLLLNRRLLLARI